MPRPLVGVLPGRRRPQRRGHPDPRGQGVPHVERDPCRDRTGLLRGDDHPYGDCVTAAAEVVGFGVPVSATGLAVAAARADRSEERIETSLYMIKPEAMHARTEIRRILGCDLQLGENVTTVLPDDVLDEFYPDITEPQRTLALALFDTPVEIGLVHGPDAINLLLRITGHETAPDLCDPHSIRYRFGVRKPIPCGGGVLYKNAIHRPRDRVEAADQLRLVRRIIASRHHHDQRIV